jgi:hypothetical protein
MGNTMKLVRQLVIWAFLGAVFGTATGIIGRALGFGALNASLVGGMIAAPTLVMVIMLANYWGELLNWALGGALVGTVILTAMDFLVFRAVVPVPGSPGLSGATLLNRAIIGAVVSTWLGAGGVVFKRGSQGLVGFLAAIILGAPLGVLTWMLADIVGGEVVSLQLLNTVYSWRWSETLVGIPLGALTGYFVIQFMFRTEYINTNRKRPG